MSEINWILLFSLCLTMSVTCTTKRPKFAVVFKFLRNYLFVWTTIRIVCKIYSSYTSTFHHDSKTLRVHASMLVRFFLVQRDVLPLKKDFYLHFRHWCIHLCSRWPAHLSRKSRFLLIPAGWGQTTGFFTPFKSKISFCGRNACELWSK